MRQQKADWLEKTVSSIWNNRTEQELCLNIIDDLLLQKLHDFRVDAVNKAYCIYRREISRGATELESYRNAQNDYRDYLEYLRRKHS